MKKLALIIVLVVLLVGVVGVVGAQAVEQGRPGGRDGFGHPDGRGRHGQMNPDRGDALRQLVQIVADETGLMTEEIVQLVRDGATLAEVIEQNNGSVEAVTAEAVIVITEHIQTAVENGRLTPERADEMLANLEQHITDALNGELRDGFSRGAVRAIVGVAEEVASATGLTLEEIRAQVEAGATLESILTENNVDVEAFSANVIAKAEEYLTTQVAEGEITQELADIRLSEFTERLPDILSHTFHGRGNRSTSGSI